MKRTEELGLIFPKAQQCVEAAWRLANEAHAGQVRKYTNDPYILHPEAVAQIVYSVVPDLDMVMAALLHDVLEDCPDYDEDILIDWGMGPRVVRYVRGLTDVFTKQKFPYLNRATRKDLEARRLGAAHRDVQSIKCADLLHNTSSIVQHDPDFARKYMAEKEFALHMMQDAHAGLKSAAQNVVSIYWRDNP